MNRTNLCSRWDKSEAGVALRSSGFRPSLRLRATITPNGASTASSTVQVRECLHPGEGDWGEPGRAQVPQVSTLETLETPVDGPKWVRFLQVSE